MKIEDLDSFEERKLLKRSAESIFIAYNDLSSDEVADLILSDSLNITEAIAYLTGLEATDIITEVLIQAEKKKAK
ncbi:hypothetical protein ABLA30_14720 [Xenorhabdus nematophila]|uniref:hypothetical protein n=1 Tax=Xenorhabdus nematophila TaxID=628 RepID=UPI0032B87DDE